MIRIADIIGGSPEEDKSNKDKQRQEEQKEVTPPPNVELVKSQPQSPSDIAASVSKEEIKQRQEPAPIELSKSMLDKVRSGSPHQSRLLYEGLLKSLETICRPLTSREGVDLSEINNKLSALIDQIALGNEEFLLMINSHYPDKYLYAHMLNVTVLSISLGRQMGFNKSRLLELSLGAFLHDIGLCQFEELIYAPRKLSNEEYMKIKQHPISGAKILEKCKGITEAMLSIVRQHHERRDGSGYPCGLKADKIEESAQIVGLVNHYESLIHKRPFCERVLNYQAMRSLVEQKSTFESRLLKLFIEMVSIYPVGSWVRLSSDEIAQVVSINKSYLLKPVVKIFFDKAEKRTGSERIVDLSKQLNIYIKAQIADEDIEAKLRQ